MKRILVIPRHTKYMVCVWKSDEIVYSEATCVIASEADVDYAIIQSTLHDEWARKESSSLGATLRYSPTKCFETFPFPKSTWELSDIGERYYLHRQAIMLKSKEGLTQTYNRFHDPLEEDKDIIILREMHREMDETVAKVYGWEDLKLDHGFHETKQGLRYTISEAARREVLDRLLLLNHQRHEEEVQAGLFERKGTKKVRSVMNGDGKQQAAIGNTGKVSMVFERNNTTYSDNVKGEKIEEVVEQGALFSE